MSNRPSRRVGRVRNGDAAAITATTTATGSDRERRRRVPDAGDDVQALAEAVVLDDERTDEAREEPGDEAGDGEVAGEAPAAGDERGGDDDTDRPERAHREDRFEERLQIVGQTVDELDEVDLAVGGVSLVEAEPHHDPDRDDEAEPVTRAPSVRFLRRRPERAGPQALDREPGLGGASGLATSVSAATGGSIARFANAGP